MEGNIQFVETVLAPLLPGSISPAIAALFLLVSLLGSLITAVTGAGGGVFLLTVVSLWLPPAAVVPVHGLVQAGSNGGRTLMSWRYIHWPTFFWVLPGIVAGLGAGAILLVRLPEPLWQLIIALFVIYLCWGPPLPGKALGRGGLGLMGLATSFTGLFVGVSGPLVAAFYRQLFDARFPLIATLSITLFFQHAPKAIVFGVAGFNFVDWVPLIGAMIACGAVGTWLGLRFLGRMSDHRFRQVFNLFLTLLALRLLWLSGRGFGILPGT